MALDIDNEALYTGLARAIPRAMRDALALQLTELRARLGISHDPLAGVARGRPPEVSPGQDPRLQVYPYLVTAPDGRSAWATLTQVARLTRLSEKSVQCMVRVGGTVTRQLQGESWAIWFAPAGQRVSSATDDPGFDELYRLSRLSPSEAMALAFRNQAKTPQA